MREDYKNDYILLYNMSVYHDEKQNNGVCDSKWVHQVAEAYANEKFNSDIVKVTDFMKGWHDFYYHMFD